MWPFRKKESKGNVVTEVALYIPFSILPKSGKYSCKVESFKIDGSTVEIRCEESDETLTPREEITENLKLAAEVAKKVDEKAIAVILHSIIGAIYAGHDETLAGRCAEFCEQSIGK